MPLPLLLVVLSSLAWAGLDSCRKALLRVIEPVPLLALLTLASVPAFAVWAAASAGSEVGGGGTGGARDLLQPGYLAPALGSVLLNLVANLAFMQAVRLSPLSLTIPLLSLTPAFATLLAIPLLGEKPGPADAAGVLLVVAGALWLNWQSFAGGETDRGAGGAPAPRPSTSFWQILRREPGVPLMALTALVWSLTSPLDKLAVLHAGASRHALVVTAGVGLGFLLVLALRGELRELAHARRAPGLFALAVGVSVLAFGLQLLALNRVWVGWVETLKRGIGNLAAVVMGRIAFGEAITPRKVLAVLLMAVGVALLVG
jgi:drug/metabolite transporter (DMT)-like permease